MRPLASRAPTLRMPTTEKRRVVRIAKSYQAGSDRAARLRKQQDERRQAAEPCAGRKQMHHVGDEVKVSGHSRRRPGMADQCGQGDQGDRCGKLKTAASLAGASADRAAARARAARTTPGRSAYRTVSARRHRAGRYRRETRRVCRTLSSTSQTAPDTIAAASASQLSAVSRWRRAVKQAGLSRRPVPPRAPRRRPCRPGQQCRGKMHAAYQDQRIGHQRTPRPAGTTARRGR